MDPVSFPKSYFELGLKMNIYGAMLFNDTQFVEKHKPKPQNLFFPYYFDYGQPRADGIGQPEAGALLFVKEFKTKYRKMPNRNNLWGWQEARIAEQTPRPLGRSIRKRLRINLSLARNFGLSSET